MIHYEIVGNRLPKQRVTRLALREDSEGMVDLVTVDESGEVVNFVLGVDRDGRFRRYDLSLNPSGFQLTKSGKIAEVND